MQNMVACEVLILDEWFVLMIDGKNEQAYRD